jgi:hypothetical protein
LPFYLFSTPDEANKKMIGEVAYTKWDSWDVKLGLDVTIGDVMEHFRKDFGLEIQSIVSGPSIVYHEDFASDTSDTMKECLEVPKKAKFVPLTIMFQDGKGGVASGPVVRFFVKKSIKKRRKDKQ